MLRADEKPSLYNHTFPRTPAFAWRPIAGAKKYEFELSTSEVGDDGAVLWSSSSLSAPIKTPATSVPVSLPWITGNPYSLYARVRGIDSRGRAGRWSRPYGFNMRWPTKPVPMSPQHPGLIRWTPVEGATMYEVWLRGARVDVPDDDERRRPARPLHLPPLDALDGQRGMARSRRPPPLRRDPERSPGRLVRALEQHLRQLQPARAARPALRRRNRVRLGRQPGRSTKRDRPRAHARVHLERRHTRRPQLRALPRGRLHGRRLREPRLLEQRRRQPGLGAARRRRNQVARNPQRAHVGGRRVADGTARALPS